MKLRIGSRASRLAVVQAQLLMDALRAAHPTLELELVTMTTTGDRILDRPLDQVGGKGLFVKELDQALREGRVDLTVHSAKDLPAQLPEDLPILAVSRREAPFDALVLPRGAGAFDPALPVGCSSLRRALQLGRLYPGVAVAPVRGNVPTRLEKLDRGEYGALVLAQAGLLRLGLGSRVSRVFAPDEMLPAACQGILAVQGRAGFDTGLLDCFADAAAWDAFSAERAFVRALDGGCTSPAAAYAVVGAQRIALQGLYVDDANGMHRAALSGPRSAAAQLGGRLAQQFLDRFR